MCHAGAALSLDMLTVELCVFAACCNVCCVVPPQAKRGVPLLQLSPQQLAPVKQIQAALQASAAPRNDQCETCKVLP